MPTVETEFQFHAAGLDFHSTDYVWLVVPGPKAQYKDRAPPRDRRLRVPAHRQRGTEEGGRGMDWFRIKVWDKASDGVVYDDQLSHGETADATSGLGGGSIVSAQWKILRSQTVYPIEAGGAPHGCPSNWVTRGHGHISSQGTT